MGIYDRDWWKDHRAQQERAKNEAPPDGTPTDLPGKDWHWSVKLLFLGWCAMVLYLAAKLAMGVAL